MNLIERLLVGLENAPWNILYRAAVGFASLSLFVRLRSVAVPDWWFGPTLLVILIALRVAPVVARKVLPFSGTAQDIWDKRRQLAKRYDSYQWRKLLGFGIGVVAYLIFSRQASTPIITLTTVCLVAGLIGEMRWYAIAHKAERSRV
jgi:DMSO reductase anchor subunit